MASAGQTALQVGARSGSLGVVEELLSHQANVSVRDNWGESRGLATGGSEGGRGMTWAVEGGRE